MLRAEELMVGDWVRVKDCIDQFYYFDEYEPGEIVQVREILDNGINPNWAGAEVSGILGLEDIQPIPITPEILEKNGFEKLDFSHFQIGDRRLVLDADGRWDGPLSWNWVVTEMDTNAKGQPVVLDYYVATINCVHELQRALRCVGLFELANNIKL